jgi:diguanylate cyclase (GGDEF)-like protein
VTTIDPRARERDVPLLLRATEALLLAAHDEQAVLATAARLREAVGERDDDAARALSRLTELVLLHARADERRRDTIAELRTVNEVAVAAAALDLDGALRAATEGFQRCTTSDSTAIYLWDEASERLVLGKLTFDPQYYPGDYEERVRSQPLRLGEGMVGWAAEHREAAMIDDVAKDPRPQAVAGVPLSSKAAIVIPLVVEDRLLGVIRAVKMGVGTYSQDQFRFAQTLGAQLALLLATAQANRARATALEEAQRLASTDALTGLFNARYLKGRIEEEVARAERYGHELALLIVDSDALKRVNDRLGHAAGNGLLVDLASAIRAHVRSTDLVARFGGDEFVVLMPETKIDAALVTAERIRAAAYTAAGAAGVERSVSVGAATYPRSAASADELFQRADSALYEAKRAGKNRVMAAAV